MCKQITEAHWWWGSKVFVIFPLRVSMWGACVCAWVCVCLYAHLVLTPSVITNQQRSFLAYPVTSLLNHMSDWPWSPGAAQSLAQPSYSQLTSHTHPSEKWSAYSVITHCRLRIDFTHSSVPYSVNPKRKWSYFACISKAYSVNPSLHPEWTTTTRFPFTRAQCQCLVAF